MKTALAVVIKASPSAWPPNRIRNTSAVRKKLSLNAAKNWQANSGAKRLESKSGGMAADYRKVPAAGVMRARKKSGGRPAAPRRYRIHAALRDDRNPCLLGLFLPFILQNHRAERGRDSNAGGDGENSYPHVPPPSLRPRARVTSSRANARKRFRFHHPEADRRNSQW